MKLLKTFSVYPWNRSIYAYVVECVNISSLLIIEGGLWGSGA